MQNPDTPSPTLVDLETKFWQSMVDHETDVALTLLCEPALMVSSHGAMQFDHDAYRKMAGRGSMEIQVFGTGSGRLLPTKLTVSFPTFRWVSYGFGVRRVWSEAGIGPLQPAEQRHGSNS